MSPDLEQGGRRDDKTVCLAPEETGIWLVSTSLVVRVKTLAMMASLKLGGVP